MESQTLPGSIKRFSAPLTDLTSPYEPSDEDGKRESLSSRGSWMRRLSTLPRSYSNNSQASMEPKSPLRSSPNTMQTSISSSLPSKPTQRFRNKLVKRSQPVRTASAPEAPPEAKSKFPTIQRPATSHRRSVLQQQQFQEKSETTKYMAASSSPSRLSSSCKAHTPESPSMWRLYFEVRSLKSLFRERPQEKSIDGNKLHRPATFKRIVVEENTTPTLVMPWMIMSVKSRDMIDDDSEGCGIDDFTVERRDNSAEVNVRKYGGLLGDLGKRPRRSLSMPFASMPLSPRSGSLGDPMTVANGRGRGRCFSVPITSMSGGSELSTGSLAKKRSFPLRTTVLDEQISLDTEENTTLAESVSTSFHLRNSDTSPSLPKISRLSCLSDDLARLGLSSSTGNSNSTSPKVQMPKNPYNSSFPMINPVFTRPISFSASDSPDPHIPEITDRSSTLIGSDTDFKGLASCDEDDADFRSETVFDSFRTGATGSIRSHNNPLLDSIFDESPPSSDKNPSHTKFLMHEVLYDEKHQDESFNIVEDDSLLSRKASGKPYNELDFRKSTSARSSSCIEALPLSLPCVSFPNEPSGTFSHDDYDDDDEDWTKDEGSPEVEINVLTFENAETVTTKHQNQYDVQPSQESEHGLPRPSENLKCNVFDWSEPSVIDRFGYQGSSPRPRTAHVKQIMDGRGGRSLGRRGPSALHIRSQSVPVVPDLESAKLTSKFGTWGLGTKAISEDWDGDFEFDSIEPTNANEGENSARLSGVLVPEAIQASQQNIAGHVGQIREVCLLVEDLKRLWVLGKSQGLLDGEFASLWQQAEGIIALAAPVEDEKQEEQDVYSSTITHISPFVKDDHCTNFPGEEEDQEKFKVDFSDENPKSNCCSTGLVSSWRQGPVITKDGLPGTCWMIHSSTKDHSSCSPSVISRPVGTNSPTEVARKVMESMHQQRSSSDPLLQKFVVESGNKMPFDTTSLRDLVCRAATLSRTLGDIVRAAEGGSSSLNLVRKQELSPAFTRVFSDPVATSPKSLPRSQSNNSILSKSIDVGPNLGLSQLMHMMAVV